MSTLAQWLRERTTNVPVLAELLAKSYGDILEETAAPADGRWAHSGEAYPWNTTWRGAERAPRWLFEFVGHDEDTVVDWLRSGAFLPSPEETLLMDLANHFRANASWVMAGHGNVRDYIFDAHLGYATFPEVLTSHWIDSRLFAPGSERLDAAVIGLSISAGLHLVRSVDGGSAGKILRERIGNHRDQNARLGLDDRILCDLALLEDLFEDKTSSPLLVLLERPSLFLGNHRDPGRPSAAVEYLLRWSARIPASPRHLVVLLADEIQELHDDLRKRVNGIVQFELSRPFREIDRRRFLLACHAACGWRPIRLPATRLRARSTGLPFGTHQLRHFSEATAGLNLVGIETCLLSLLEQTDPTDPLSYLKGQRRELLSSESEGMLEIVEPSGDLSGLVGGLENLKSRLRSIVLGMIAEPGSVARMLVPMGLLFVGPPGTGKSLTASALAAECSKAGVSYVKMGDFRDMWVGQSERKFSRILRVLEAFGQVIVFLDEIDQTEGGSRSRGDRHETSRRIFGKLLEFMADQNHRGRILWIAATNRPGEIDPALLRPGRFDLILPFEPPDARGCAQILLLHLNRCGMPHDFDPPSLAQTGQRLAGRQLTGAEIQLLVIEAGRRSVSAQRSILGREPFLEVLDDYTGQAKTGEEYLKMVEECRRFLPFRSARVS